MQDISHLSVAELERLQVEAEALIAAKKDQAIENAYQQVLAIAESVNLTLDELIELGQTKQKKVARKVVEPRYKNTANPEETWTGRGKQPRWLVAQLEQGAKLEDFLI